MAGEKQETRAAADPTEGMPPFEKQIFTAYQEGVRNGAVPAELIIRMPMHKAAMLSGFLTGFVAFSKQVGNLQEAAVSERLYQMVHGQIEDAIRKCAEAREKAAS